MTASVDDVDDAEADAGVDAEEEADASGEWPSADIEVEDHIHFAMTGSFPLRIAEILFTGSGLYIAEYAYVTPLFGLATKSHRREAGAMQYIYEKYGIDGVILHADRVFWLNYGMVDRVVLYSGGSIGRPKVTVYAKDGESYAYRVIGEQRDFEQLSADVEAAADGHDVPVEVNDRLGFSPRESIARFFTQ